MSVYVCVCERKRDRDREREFERLCERVRERIQSTMYAHVRDIEGVSEYERARAWEGMCVG